MKKFSQSGKLDEDTMPGIMSEGKSQRSYTLLSASKGIYSDGSSVALNDLAISEVVDTLAFRLIVNALLIATVIPERDNLLLVLSWFPAYGARGFHAFLTDSCNTVSSSDRLSHLPGKHLD